MTPKQEAVFFKVHAGLPREGPGDAQSTRRAFACLRDLPDRPRVLDLGCGPGAQTLELAESCAGEIIAVDNHAPFIEGLRRRVLENGLADRVHPLAADMKSLPFEPDSFDLIWAEGSIYLIGFSRGLAEWRPLLAGRGHVAVTEVSWLKDDVPAELLASFTLPDSAWWEPYYRPIEGKLGALEARHAGDAEALQVLAAERQEIELFRKYSDCYGYVFYVARRR